MQLAIWVNLYFNRWGNHPILKDISLAINISPKEFQQDSYIKSLLGAIQNCAYSEKLIIEITENTLVDDLQSAAEILNVIHSTGAKIAIDDFGTGYSSFGYLKKLPIDNIKIDKSFILDLQTNKDSKTIVKSIVALAHALNMSVVAEGVEDQYHLDFIKSLNCQEAQGYYYAPAMELEKFEKWVEDFYK